MLIFLAITIGITVYSHFGSNIVKLFAPYNPQSMELCGVGAQQGYPYLYYANYSDPRTAVCTDRCPFETQNIFNYCIPDYSKSGAAERTKQENSNLLVDLRISLGPLAASFGVILLLNFLYLMLLSRYTKIMSIIGLVFVEVMFIVGIGVGLWATLTFNIPPVGPIFLLVFALIFNLALWCFRDAIAVGLAILEASADFLASTKRILLVSVFYSLSLLIVFSFTIWSCLYIVAKNEIVGGMQDKEIQWSGANIACLTIVVFTMIWFQGYIRHCLIYVVYQSMATFYFSSNKTVQGSAEVGWSIKNAHTTHAGSLSFAALIITVVRILRNIAESAARNNNGGNAARVVGLCLMCLLSCIEDILNYLDHLALAYMSVTGESFCESAFSGFMLNLKYLWEFYFSRKIAHGIVGLGSLAISLLSVGFMAIILWSTGKFSAMTTTWLPLLICFIFALIISSLFMRTISHGVDAALMCMAVDMDLNGEKPAFGPPDFHKALEEYFGESDNKVYA